MARTCRSSHRYWVFMRASTPSIRSTANIWTPCTRERSGFVDDEIDRLLAAVDARSPLADSLVVVVSDHGEELGDHGSLEGHGWTLYEEILHVPMIWSFPDAAHQGTVVREPVGLIDVAPTILDFLGIESPVQFQGRSLLPLLGSRELAMTSIPVDCRFWRQVRHLQARSPGSEIQAHRNPGYRPQRDRPPHRCRLRALRPRVRPRRAP